MKKTLVEIDVWSDYVCPFCYLAEPTLTQMQQEFRGELRISWHAFELRPDPVPTLDPKGDYLREVWQGSVYPMAQSRGVVLRLPPVQPRSRLAHEAAAFASDEGRFEEMNNALFRAFFEHGEDIGRPDILTQLATSAGIDGGKLATALKTKRYRQRILADETKAHELGLSGVPAALVRAAGEPLERALLVEGAQPVEVFRQAVTRVLHAESRR